MRMYARFRPSVESMERKDCPSGFGPEFGGLVSTGARDLAALKPLLPLLGYANYGDLISNVATTHAGGPNA
jgi:hypothetical protein